MKKQEYAIVDIETTGGNATHSKITEIAIIIYDGEKIIGVGNHWLIHKSIFQLQFLH